MATASRLLSLSVLISTLLIAHPVSGNGFRNPPEGARALALGARSVMIDDASAIAHNPANLMQLEVPELLYSLTFGYSRHEAQVPGGAKSSTTENLKMLPNFFIAAPWHDGVIGLGVTTPYGQSTVWDKDSVFQYQAPYFAEMRLVNINPTYAWRLTDELAIGLGLDIFLSDLSFKQQVPWSSVIPGSPDGKFDFYGKGYGLGFNLGLAWNPVAQHHFALTYRSPVRVTYDGDMEVSNKPSPLPGSARSDFETTIDFPTVVAAGYAWQVKPEVKLGVQVEWVEFSRYEQLKLKAGENDALLPANTISQDWNDIVTVGLGCEWQVRPDWSLRGGYDYLPSPIPDSTHAPIIPDADRHIVSVGVGYRFGQHSLDVTYAHSFFENRTVTNADNPAYDAEWHLQASLLVFSYGFTF